MTPADKLKQAGGRVKNNNFVGEFFSVDIAKLIPDTGKVVYDQAKGNWPEFYSTFRIVKQNMGDEDESEATATPGACLPKVGDGNKVLLGPNLKLELNLWLTKELLRPGVLLRVRLEIEKPSSQGGIAEEEKIADLLILSKTEN